MLTHLDPRLRGVAALLAAGVYLVPPALGVVAEISHVAYHVHEAMEIQRQKAAAFGLAPVGERQMPSFETGGHHEFVHTHNGLMHHHDEVVDALLSAVGHADTEIKSPSPPSAEISTHLPPAGAPTLPTGDLSRSASWGDERGALRPPPRPLIPPPRA